MPLVTTPARGAMVSESPFCFGAITPQFSGRPILMGPRSASTKFELGSTSFKETGGTALLPDSAFSGSGGGRAEDRTILLIERGPLARFCARGDFVCGVSPDRGCVLARFGESCIVGTV